MNNLQLAEILCEKFKSLKPGNFSYSVNIESKSYANMDSRFNTTKFCIYASCFTKESRNNEDHVFISVHNVSTIKTAINQLFQKLLDTDKLTKEAAKISEITNEEVKEVLDAIN